MFCPRSGRRYHWHTLRHCGKACPTEWLLKLMLRDGIQGTEHIILFNFFFSLHRHHYKYLDTLYFWFEDCIIFGCGVILIFVASERVRKGAHGPNHQDFCVMTVHL